MEAVDYAGLPGHPSSGLAERLYGGRTGSIFAFTVPGGADGARTFIDRLQLFSRMTNIGDTRSLVLHPATTTHRPFSEETRRGLGITPGLVRLSIGLEGVDDLIQGLDNGLRALVRG
ncbi:PLP-dependent transferase [Microbacterium sp. 18062]|uniref:PLP-dependent transferase n=1 Tax=Microbacterium sp. 18062 TaxID=2681410 RepID=UPI001F3322BD|nr:PLP-dependent transferase [Microbacterium sp. 18062]